MDCQPRRVAFGGRIRATGHTSGAPAARPSGRHVRNGVEDRGVVVPTSRVEEVSGDRRRAGGTRRGDRRRYAEMTEDALDHSRFLDERDQTQATAAAGTGQHVESERPPQRRCHAGFGAGGAHRDVGEPIGSRSLRHLLTTTPRTMPRPIRHGLTGRSRQATVGRMVDVRKTDVFAR